VFLSLFDPLLAIAAGAGIALGLGGTALWTHRSQLIHAVQRLLQALREPRRVHRRLPMVFVGGPIVLAGGICVRVLYESAVWDAVTAVLTGVILGGLTWLLRVRRRQAIHESVWRRVWRVVRLVLLLLLIGIDGLFLVAIVFAVAEASLPIAVAAIVLAAIGVAGALVSSRVSRAGTSPTGGTSDVASPAPERTQWRRPDERVARIKAFHGARLLLHPTTMPPRMLLAFAAPWSLTARTLGNPRLASPGALDRPQLRRIEIPAAGGVGTVRAIARCFGELATGARTLGLTDAP
jgi:hypothetical protein